MRVFGRIKDHFEEREVNRLMTKAKSQPLYHIHLRKTAGTSLNMGVLNALVDGDADEVYEKMAAKLNHRLIKDEHVLVGWNKALIEQGQYHYAFSHIPRHLLKLPSNVVTFTCLRNPVNRVVSHYKMLLNYQVNNIDHPCMAVEGEWLGNGFEDFLDRIPKRDLMAQLYCFSESYNVQEAIEALRDVDCVLRVETIEQDKSKLEDLLGLPIELANYKRFDIETEISENSMNRLSEMVADELEFYQSSLSL